MEYRATISLKDGQKLFVVYLQHQPSKLMAMSEAFKLMYKNIGCGEVVEDELLINVENINN